MMKITKPGLLQLLVAITITLTITIAITTPAAGYNDDYAPHASVNDTNVYSKQLILNIYVDETGKALVTGYVEPGDVETLAFLETSSESECIYENDTNQLYALTNALTWKYGDRWVMNFTTNNCYAEYHTTFYLPGNVRLAKIECSHGLDYFVMSSNKSFVIDIQGYDVETPMTSIEYLQPLKETETGGADGGFWSGVSSEYLIPIVGLSVLALVLALIIAIMKIKGVKDAKQNIGINTDTDTGSNTNTDTGSTEHVEAPRTEKGGITITSEMARVMETLTDRERAVVNALIKHGREMFQVDIRYETEIPKSSLTAILRSLEKRKLIKKKEWGRTNLIILSEWFLID
uniref:HTH arsR-type domain-containing protein n=1 Tax=Candidatus Methanophagaceae archaeon ANME-1 ERB6 TaxID=2759912 RepID=A0A7G9YV24_9EURY|nr:hypothetical protein PAJCOBIN_00018 [Methanosarcinales archaeon ANME-1 ERB6]